MNTSLIKQAIRISLQNIDVKGKEELENYLEVSLEDFIFEILLSIYEENKNAIEAISCEFDRTDDYIFKDVNGEYPLDIFLINRLLRNIGMIAFQRQYMFSESHYDADLREILLDAERISSLNKAQIRKVVYHEILHALKTDFRNEQFFQSRKYFELKEKIKRFYPDLVNDFSPKIDLPEGIYDVKRHVGLSYSKKDVKRIYNNSSVDDVDEILNESESIILSDDTNGATIKMSDSDRLLLVYNPESSNVRITNYGFLLKAMLNKKIVFIGQYLEPSFLIDYFNRLYTDIFKKNYGIDDTAWNIFSSAISRIKKDFTEELNIELLDTIYDCVKYKNELLESGGYESKLKQDLKDLRMRGLIEKNNKGSYVVASVVKYNDELIQSDSFGTKK